MTIFQTANSLITVFELLEFGIMKKCIISASFGTRLGMENGDGILVEIPDGKIPFE
jgi:hypothetical protein